MLKLRLLDWLRDITLLGTSNQKALFQRSIATLKFVYDIGSWVTPVKFAFEVVP